MNTLKAFFTGDTRFNIWTLIKVILVVGLTYALIKNPSMFAMLALLSFLVIAHELGHFAVAKWVGIKVERFGFGLPIGPTLYERKVGETTICIHAALLGGYVSFPDDSEDSSEPEDSPRRFENKPAWARIAVVLAGVTVNAILAYLLMFLVLGVWGFPSGLAVKDFLKPSTAKVAGIQKGDFLVGINGEQILPYEWPRFSQAVRAAEGKAIEIMVYRDNAFKTFTMKSLPKGDLIGVELEPKMTFIPLKNPQDIVPKSHEFLVSTIALNFDAMGKLIMGKLSPKVLSGPVGIVKQGSEAIRDHGLAEGLFIAAILSAILAVMNVLPIPMLDGGHLVFILLEVIRGGKPLHKGFQEQLVKVCFFALIGLMVVLLVHDVNTHILGH
jgi:regulator of sigma E protease